MKRIDEIFAEAIKSGTFPGGVLLVGDHEKVIFEKSYGTLSKDSKEPVSNDTIYDLASMTKVVATTPAIMKLIEDGNLRLYDPISLFLDEFKTDEKKEIRIFHLLTHTSGLPSYSEGWKYTRGKDLMKVINSTPPINPVGSKYLYSCLNFITLMEIIEMVSGRRFDEFTRSEIFEPLDMFHTAFRPPKDWKIAPTSQRDGRTLQGDVDDELAYYLGGISGNAGLFSNVTDLYNYAKMYLNQGKHKDRKIFSKETIESFTCEAFNDGQNRRTLGWDMKGFACSCGDLMTKYAFGHTGFTGTSIWIDPRIDIAVILLTNRVNISRRENQDKIIRFRPLLHNYIVANRGSLGE
ncbi:serine hydrolase domain-containing protein [Athalassotoga saccharophila]|uniref:serine hydrolase domain-containing protein n=1 Tax=Athalassotoga saccharophila TaxID=1441386 RepID=UPI0018D679F4|nr:serine hydrolase domain-containing protein [Athalassotoga saccharophila]BBJ28798.1 esterase EstB [Athalassotoga saccharophila]